MVMTGDLLAHHREVARAEDLEAARRSIIADSESKYAELTVRDSRL